MAKSASFCLYWPGLILPPEFEVAVIMRTLKHPPTPRVYLASVLQLLIQPVLFVLFEQNNLFFS